MSRLSPHLGWHEVLDGSGYRRLQGVPDELVANMRETAKAFELLRAELGRPIIIVRGGGLRTPKANRGPGMSRRSQHLQGKALDMRCRRQADTDRLFGLVNAMQRDGRLPRGGAAEYRTESERVRFTHMDVRGRLSRWQGSKKRAG